MSRLIDILIDSNVMASRAMGRRYILGGGVKVDGEVIKNTEYEVMKGSLIKVGKRGPELEVIQ